MTVRPNEHYNEEGEPGLKEVSEKIFLSSWSVIPG